MTRSDDARVTAAPVVADLDPAALRARYRAERDRRGHPLRNAQWLDVEGARARFARDPQAPPAPGRPAVDETTDALVIGGGFGGLLAAARLIEAGVTDIRIVETASDFGGTWYWNRYPGAQCDIESYIYLPLLEETGYVPSEKYAHAEEIFAHAQRIGRHYGLYARALFGTQVETMTWSEPDRRWIAATDRGDRIAARHVVSASGPLNRPRLPAIPGLDVFEGRAFHTSRWDYGYTGGGPRGGMTGLAGKRVAVIGTGATAVQCLPYLAADAAHVSVFQRTPSTVSPRGNRPTDPSWAASLTPGWQRRRMDNFNAVVAGEAVETDLVDDGWTDLARSLRTRVRLARPEPDGETARQTELADFLKGEQIRARVDAVVRDPATAEALKAWYYVFCKRPTFNDGYLDAFNRPNVTLVDTRGRGPDRIAPDGVEFDGVRYLADCIVLATGFEVGVDYSRRADFTVRGVGGLTLSDRFAQGMQTLHGLYSDGFPNWFLLGLGQSPLKYNFTDLLDEQAAHIAHIIGDLRRRGRTRIEARADAVAGWQAVIRERGRGARAFLADCTPGYYNGEGDVEQGFMADTFGGAASDYTRMLAASRADPDHPGFTVD